MENLREIPHYLEKANQIAQCLDWQVLVRQTLEMLQEICQAEAALLYHPGQLVPQTGWLGSPKDAPADRWEAARTVLLQPGLFESGSPQCIDQGSPAFAALRLPVALKKIFSCCPSRLPSPAQVGS